MRLRVTKHILCGAYSAVPNIDATRVCHDLIPQPPKKPCSLSEMSKPLSILFLHGYTQSGSLFHAKTKALEKPLLKSLPPQSTLSYPTAPHLLKLSDLPGERADDGGDSAQEHYAWWRKDEVTGEYLGLNETLEFLSRHLDTHGPFDGVVGFSQGAALAAMLVSLLEATPGRNRPEAFTTSHPPMKFGACYSGFRAPVRYEFFYTPRIATPILHVLGSLDTAVDESRSLELVEACEGGEKRKVYHPGGHYLPAGRQYANVLIGFILENTKDPQVRVPEDAGDSKMRL